MFSQEFIQGVVDGLVLFATDLLMPTMVFVFAVAVVLRMLIYYTIRREHWFAIEFEKRVHNFLDSVKEEKDQNLSFFVICKRLLEKTYYELFEVRAIMRRRKFDHITPFTDRLFMIQHGTARLVRDTQKQTRYLKYNGAHPKLQEISKNVFENNPCFNKVFGVIPAAMFNDVLNILPGIFIIGGIFGTFLGIMDALPQLTGMELADIEGTKQTMDSFLGKIAFAMSTSIVGIILSVLMTFANTMFSAEKMFMTIVDRFENALDNLWNRCENNALPKDIKDFDEHKDPIEALAEQAVDNEIRKHQKPWVVKEAS